jgi:SAM-dependent methyltransferase
MSPSWTQFKRRIPHWGRIVMDRRIEAFLSSQPVHELDAAEISGWSQEKRPWRTYRALNFPSFDICTADSLDSTFDVVFCEQVLEHVPDPARALANIRALLRPGGLAVVSVPFMVRIHNEPGDFWRFTPAGLRLLVERAGLEVIEEGDWGNRASVVANLWFWFPHLPGLQPMWRSPAVPLVVWSISRRSHDPAQI